MAEDFDVEAMLEAPYKKEVCKMFAVNNSFVILCLLLFVLERIYFLIGENFFGVSFGDVVSQNIKYAVWLKSGLLKF